MSWTKIVLAVGAFVVTTMPVLLPAWSARRTKARRAPVLAAYLELEREAPEDPGVWCQLDIPGEPDPPELTEYYRKRDAREAWAERVREVDRRFGFKRDEVYDAVPPELESERLSWETDLRKLRDSGVWTIAGAALAVVAAFTK